jgi:hypothetical protein
MALIWHSCPHNKFGFLSGVGSLVLQLLVALVCYGILIYPRTHSKQDLPKGVDHLAALGCAIAMTSILQIVMWLS